MQVHRLAVGRWQDERGAGIARWADSTEQIGPKLDRLAARVRRDGGCDQIGEVFLCASWLAASCPGQRGRTDMRRSRDGGAEHRPTFPPA
jgi:hypothetical protein